MAKVYEVEVTVKPLRPTQFPLDMLRYDGLAPKTQADAGKIERSVNDYVRERDEEQIVLTRWAFKDWRPNVERWSSFGWHVDSIRQLRTVS